MNKREPFIKPTGALHFFAARLFSALPGKLIPFHGWGQPVINFFGSARRSPHTCPLLFQRCSVFFPDARRRGEKRQNLLISWEIVQFFEILFCRSCSNNEFSVKPRRKIARISMQGKTPLAI